MSGLLCAGCATNLTTMDEINFNDLGEATTSTKITQRSFVTFGTKQMGKGSVGYKWRDGNGNLEVNGDADADGTLSPEELQAVFNLLTK
jgi:hypothetical protein